MRSYQRLFYTELPGKPTAELVKLFRCKEWEGIDGPS